MNKLIAIGGEMISYVRDIFPVNAEISDMIEFDTDDYKCRVVWLLKNDATRPSKRSKIIIIRITRETLDEYINSKDKITWLIKLKSHIKKNYDNFNPNHNNTENEASPIEEWPIRSEMFNV